MIFLVLAGFAHVPDNPLLSVLTRIDPLTYVAGPTRQAVVSHLSFPSAFGKVLAPGITWDGWLVPLWLSLAMVAVMGLGLMAIAIAEFSKTE